jgi:hypothetical protein
MHAPWEAERTPGRQVARQVDAVHLRLADNKEVQSLEEFCKPQAVSVPSQRSLMHLFHIFPRPCHNFVRLRHKSALQCARPADGLRFIALRLIGMCIEPRHSINTH